MAQTPALLHSSDAVIDYTPVADVAAGTVVEIGTIPMIAPVAIKANVKGCLVARDIWKVPQIAAIITAGDAVYWDPTGNPYGGTVGSGAATGTAASLNLMGVCVKTSTATDTYVYVFLTAAKRTTTIAGSVTADDISGSDSTLTITGKAGAAGSAGGTCVGAGGAGDTNGAGGAVGDVGGAGAGTGAGGANVNAGGASGSGATGNGGLISNTGGAALSTNGDGGLSSSAGGAGAGTGAGGANTNVGGASGAGATGNGGLISNTGGAALSTNGDGGAANHTGGVATGTGTGGGVGITSGASGGAGGTAGDVAIDCGAPTGGTAGALTLGGTNAGSITMGKMPIVPAASVAAIGADQAGAAPIATGITWATAANNAKGIRLPAAVAGLICIIKNDDAANDILFVYPATDDTINAIAANTKMDMAAKTSAMFVCLDGTAWFTVSLLPS